MNKIPHQLSFFQYGNPELNGGGGWGIFNALFGWQNSATYGSVISYNIYWIFVILMFFAMRYNEVKGHWPLMKAKKVERAQSPHSGKGSETESGVFEAAKGEKVQTAITPVPAQTISEA